jgi:hypothetical protein
MRKLITAAILFAALAAPATAGAAIVHAESGAGARNHKLLWTLDYDTATDNLTIDATHTQFDGSPAIGDPQEADIVLVRPNGQERVFNLLTIVAVSDGLPGILNKGPQTYTNVPLRIPPGRASLIEIRTEYTPPLGA